MKFKAEIKIPTSSKVKLVFVKVPDGESPTQKDLCLGAFLGYSHELTDEQIGSLFASRKEFHQMCNQYQILYDYSAYTGKWAVLLAS
jgi:hypothetical protein